MIQSIGLARAERQLGARSKELLFSEPGSAQMCVFRGALKGL